MAKRLGMPHPLLFGQARESELMLVNVVGGLANGWTCTVEHSKIEVADRLVRKARDLCVRGGVEDLRLAAARCAEGDRGTVFNGDTDSCRYLFDGLSGLDGALA